MRVLLSAAVLALASSQTFGAFVLVDDFNTLTPGALGGQNGWTAGNLWSVAAGPAGGDGQAAAGLFSGTASQAAYKLFDQAIQNSNSSTTVFFRIRRSGAVNSSSGVSDDPGGGLFGNFETQLNSQSGDLFNVRDGSGFDALAAGSFAIDTWYNVWMVVNNSSDTYRLWIDTGDFGTVVGAMTPIADPNGGAGDFTFAFRNGAATNPLTAVVFAIGSDANSNGTLFVDDIYVDSAGQNLSNPTIPEPATGGLLLAGGVLLGFKRRRR